LGPELEHLGGSAFQKLMTFCENMLFCHGFKIDSNICIYCLKRSPRNRRKINMESEKWYDKQQCNNGQKVGGQLPVLPNRLCRQCLFGDTGQPDANSGKEVGRTKSDSVCVSVSLPRYIQHSWTSECSDSSVEHDLHIFSGRKISTIFYKTQNGITKQQKWKEVSAKAPSEHLYQTGPRP